MRPLLVCVGLRQVNLTRLVSDGAGARIVQDVVRCLGGKHLRAIYEANGCCVPGLGSRNGHRRSAEGGGGRGGLRVKNVEVKDPWVHPDARDARDAFIAQATAQVAAALPADAEATLAAVAAAVAPVVAVPV